MIAAGRKIIIGRHDDNFHFLQDIKSSRRVRLGSLNPVELEWVDFNIISTDGATILHRGGLYPLSDFVTLALSQKLTDIMVLTNKERDLLVSDFADFGLSIVVFEECFPFFDDIRYVSNLAHNIKEARRRLQEMKDKGIRGGTARRWYSTVYRFRQERSLRYKSSLDHKVYFTCLPPYQEIFKAKEARVGRTIYALDFNSMYPACMQGSYPSPKHLKHQMFGTDDVLDVNSDDGFYRVVLKDAKDTFFLKYHPFRLAKSNKSYSFNLEVGDSLEVFLPKDEILAYSKYFASVELVEGIVASKSIAHPLAKEVRNLFSIKESSSTSNVKRNLTKFEMMMASSAANPLRYEKWRFQTLDEVVEAVEKSLSINFDQVLSSEQKIELAKSGNRLKIAAAMSGGYRAEIIKIDNCEAVYSFFSKTVSNSRIRMMTLIEKLLLVDSLEVCYANVDSLHISIATVDERQLMDLLSSDLSRDMGGLKIEAVATGGYWSDLGRYWLIGAAGVVKYANVLFRTKTTKHPFVDHRLIKRLHSLDGFKYVQPFFLRIQQTFSYKKRLAKHTNQYLDSMDYYRYDESDVSSASVASSSVGGEMVDCFHVKSALFSEVATVQCSSNITHKF